nr:uncharacterized protein LOC117852775 isoform X2 [Setaria viridis]
MCRVSFQLFSDFYFYPPCPILQFPTLTSPTQVNRVAAMAARALRSKLSERIFTHMEDARIMPHRLVKGLPPLAPQVTKIAPLGRDSAISSANPIKNMMFQSFTSKAKSGPSLIHGRRNFSSPPGTKNIPKEGLIGTNVTTAILLAYCYRPFLALLHSFFFNNMNQVPR